MGTHWFMDLIKAPKMSGEPNRLMPVVPMYHNGVINAIFFATPIRQQYLLPPAANMVR